MISTRQGCVCDRVRKGQRFDSEKDCPHCWAFWHRPAVNLARGGDGRVFLLPASPDSPSSTTKGCGCGCGKCVTVPSPPTLTLTPASTRAVVTVAVGEEGQRLHAATGEHLCAYAERVGADLVILDWHGHPDWPMSAKFAIPRVLDHYDRIAYVDADVLLRPAAPNLFDLCPADHFGAVDELPWHRAQPRFGREKGYLEFRRRLGFRDVPHLPWYFNCGVYVCPREYQWLLLPPPGPIPAAHCSEQDLVNARLLDACLLGAVRVRQLDRRANWQNWTDHGFAAAPADAVLHWSGAGDGRQDRAAEIRAWAGRRGAGARTFSVQSEK